MREILFRGKRCDTGEWVYGSYVEATNSWHEHGKHKEWIISSAFANGGYFNVAQRYAVDGNTIGQYTGLEWNEKLFEGDVLKLRDLEGETCVSEIFYDNNYACFSIRGNLGQSYPLYKVILDAFSCKIGVEFLGNVYDNQELIKNVED